MKKQLMFIIIICSLIILAGAIRTQVVISSTVEEKSTKRNLISAYTPHEPIEIINDGNFTDYGFPGTGEETDPYIIEGFNITANEGYGISITDTTKYFDIRDCYIDGFSYGIFIVDVAEGTATIINNTCTNNQYGIYLEDSPGATLTNNTCSNNNQEGICLWESSGSTLTNNSCYNDGFYFFEGTVEGYLNYVIEDNWVNEKKLGFYINLDRTTLSESLYGQLILINCTEVEVCNQELSNTSIGLYLRWCEDATLTNNTCNNNNGCGIYLSSSDAILANNTCANNHIGIYLRVSSGAILTNNTCSNNYYGIYLYNSPGAILTNNTCNNNQDGISLEVRSDACLITYNLLQENERLGIYLGYHCDNNIIHHNNFIDNNLDGTSQAIDRGLNNIWYDTATNEGNFWSDWSGTGNYSIDGEAGSVDPYPLDEEGNPPAVAEYTQISTVTIVLCFSIIMITCFFKKRRKII